MFSASQLIIAIVKTIRTNPGSFNEEKEWGLSSTAVDTSDEDSSCLIMTDSDMSSSKPVHLKDKTKTVQGQSGQQVFTNDIIEK